MSGGLAVLLMGCAHPEFTWAFAQNMDGSLHPNEMCRESLAQSLYADANREKTLREGSSNVFLVTGTFEQYRVLAFASQESCETALTHLVQRQALRTESR